MPGFFLTILVASAIWYRRSHVRQVTKKALHLCRACNLAKSKNA